MKFLNTIALVMMLGLLTYVSAQTFPRAAEITDPSQLEAGFGNLVAGVDFDGDGLPEIYACNTNFVDRNYELIPRLYKFEWNPNTAAWDSVWGVDMGATIPLQNTWPGLAYGDLDQDGKMELYWAPINYSPYPEIDRILVFEYPGDGSDDMGVADGFGGFLPNAKTSIVAGDGFNIRPVRIIIHDVDGDGTDELIFADRAGGSSSYHIGIWSVSDIPDDGNGLETWTEEFTGSGDINIGGVAGNCWDVSAIGNHVYLWGGNGSVFPVKFSNGVYESLAPIAGIAEDNLSFKGSQVVDLNGDGQEEILIASWFSSKVYVVVPDGDNLTSYQIADMSPYAVRLNGAGAGDLDNDGNMDFVFGSRYDAANTAKVPVFRVEYQGGDITNAASYVTTVVDSAYWDNNGDMDVVFVANLDGDADDEVLYTQGYSRGNPTDAPMPIIVLDPNVTPVSVERESNTIPAAFYLDQNFPNPFNPATTIKFGLNAASNVDLRVYDALGREVAVLVSNQYMEGGAYNVKFDASNLASGIYIYRLTAGDNVVSKKMQLLK